MMDIKALAYGEKEYIAALRRHFHAHPELGRHEEKQRSVSQKNWKRWGSR